MKRLVVVLAIVLAPVCAMASGGSGEAAPTAMTVAVPWAGSELDQFLPVLAVFEAKEKVKVKPLTYRSEDLATILPAQFQAHQALADIIFMWDWWVRKNPGFAVDLRDVWSTGQGAFIPAPAEEAGKVVAVPYQMSAKPGFWYRKSFFAKNGLKPPTTVAQFEDLLRAIAKVPGVRAPIVTGDGVGWPISDVTEHFLIAFGGPELQNGIIAKQVKWTDPQVRAVFEQRLVPALAQGAFSDPIEWTQAVDLWWGDEYALYFMGNWITTMVKDPADLGVFPLPGTRALVTVPDWAFIPTESQQVPLAKKLLTFMLSKEGQTIRAKQGGKLIIRKDIPASTYPPADQAVAAVVASMQTTVNDLDDSIGGDWQRLFWDQLKLLWVEPGSLDDVLRRLQEKMP
jgi:multiple sugar transport system substrate-binding protein